MRAASRRYVLVRTRQRRLAYAAPGSDVASNWACSARPAPGRRVRDALLGEGMKNCTAALFAVTTLPSATSVSVWKFARIASRLPLTASSIAFFDDAGFASRCRMIWRACRRAWPAPRSPRLHDREALADLFQ